jgi:hypothetical protein
MAGTVAAPDVEQLNYVMEEKVTDSIAPLTIPKPDRPVMPEGYGVPRDEEGMLDWSYVREMMETNMVYWVCSVRPNARPHSSPIWGAWVDDRFYFEGSPETRRGRNIEHNPAVSVHTERGDDVVIIEGVAVDIGKPDPELAQRLMAGFEKYRGKYNYMPEASNWDEGGLYVVNPTTVLAWRDFFKSATRWRFDRQD